MNLTTKQPPAAMDPIPHAAPLEALGMVTLCFGWFIVSSLQMLSNWRAGAQAPGFSDNMLVAMALIELVFGIAAIAVLRGRGYPLSALYPRPSMSGALGGLALYAVAAVLIALVTMVAPHPAGTPIADMMARTHVSLPMVILLSIVNGAYEEVFLLGYLMRGLRRYGASTALGITVLVRLLYHVYQGPVGALSVVLFGLVLGLVYQRTGRLFPMVAAHFIADALALDST